MGAWRTIGRGRTLIKSPAWCTFPSGDGLGENIRTLPEVEDFVFGCGQVDLWGEA